MKKSLMLMLLLLIPLTYAVECQISTDNSTWVGVDSTIYGGCIDDDSNMAYIQNLESNTQYYLRCRNDSTDWGYSEQKTKWVVKMEILIFGFFFVSGLVLIAFMHKFQEDEGSSIVYGFAAMLLFLILGVMTFFGFEIISDLTLPFNINTIIGLFCIILGIYSSWFSVSLWKYKRNEKEKSKEGY